MLGIFGRQLGEIVVWAGQERAFLRVREGETRKGGCEEVVTVRISVGYRGNMRGTEAYMIVPAAARPRVPPRFRIKLFISQTAIC
jgi:hypothetical protein